MASNTATVIMFIIKLNHFIIIATVMSPLREASLDPARPGRRPATAGGLGGDSASKRKTRNHQ